MIKALELKFLHKSKEFFPKTQNARKGESRKASTLPVRAKY